MFSSRSRSSPFFSIDNRYVVHRCDVSIISSSNLFMNFHKSRHRRVCLSASVVEKKLEVSWFPPDENASDDYGGWAIAETLVEKKKGSPAFLLAGIGSSIAVLLTAIAYFSLTRKGFKFQFNTPLHALHGVLMPSDSIADQSITTDSNASVANTVVSEASPECITSTISETQASVPKLERLIIPVVADSTQLEALSVLKKLKILEDDVKADELCTRREYARWLVKANSLLERNLKHRIVPSILLSGSVVGAFDDVSTEDPDFCSIQALAEAGIVLSKLSGNNSSFFELDDSKGQGRVDFLPERFITRLDLINWKAQLEYPFMPGIEEKISRTKVDFMDVKGISSDASRELFMDMLAGDKSILRKVFGQSKRLQPSKPATKAQAAVALTSGRMTEAIHTELSRLVVENSLRQAEIEEIRSELLLRGEIQRFWDEKLNKQQARGLVVERDFLAAVHDLEQEKVVREKSLSDYLKETAALDCQKQLLLSLKEEVNEMSKRLMCERANFMVEQQTLEAKLIDLQSKQEGMFDAKSILEAEKEALRILRSWIEDEARKSQARAKVLEEVRRRWNWDDQS
ncbi:hypothetical protein HHK36_015043 [Tetracentron sinense]|uniref:SLH domain-containing protein n=1 Tax=Tetracentron sinense TaxID=13715 RepID=A0A835DD98_TETSI|nr:hypothetical protein HHK36_015043 [Tetracentron sinense]